VLKVQGTRGWLGFVNDIPLTWKFVLIYLLCVLMPILTINVLFYKQVSENIRVREENNLHMTIDQAARRTMEIIVGGVTLSHSIATDRGLYESLDREYPDLVAFYDMFNSGLNDKIKSFLTAYTYVENISVYTDNHTIANGGHFFILGERETSSVWYRTARDSVSAVNIVVYQDDNPITRDGEKEYFSIIRRLNEYSLYNKHTKYLKIDLKISRIEDILNQEAPYFRMEMVDDKGNVQFPLAARRSLAEPNVGEAAGRGNNMVLESTLGAASYIQGWKIIGIAGESQFQTALNDATRFIWMLAAISTLVPTTLIFVMLRSYNYRIKRLARHMDKAKNEKFDLIRLREGKDEIGGLIRSFNRMTETIEALINDVYKLEIQQKDMQLEQVRAELKLLQSQMNPHFLFNTLNALLVVSAKNGYTEVTDIIKDLSLLLRRMLSWSEDAVTLQEELHFTEMYLKIEKFRFADRFDYSIEIDEASARCMVPKMCIQPLVENACKHGLQSVKGQRFIRIEAHQSGAYLYVRVQDNGKGMTTDRLAFIRSQMNSGLDADENVGLRNVYRRLRLHYGNSVDLKIESAPQQGTTISFRIPVKP
jgi:two-component system sensor histidine kinase YesM